MSSSAAKRCAWSSGDAEPGGRIVHAAPGRTGRPGSTRYVNSSLPPAANRKRRSRPNPNRNRLPSSPPGCPSPRSRPDSPRSRPNIPTPEYVADRGTNGRFGCQPTRSRHNHTRTRTAKQLPQPAPACRGDETEFTKIDNDSGLVCAATPAAKYPVTALHLINNRTGSAPNGMARQSSVPDNRAHMEHTSRSSGSCKIAEKSRNPSATPVRSSGAPGDRTPNPRIKSPRWGR